MEVGRRHPRNQEQVGDRGRGRSGRRSVSSDRALEEEPRSQELGSDWGRDHAHPVIGLYFHSIEVYVQCTCTWCGYLCWPAWLKKF